MAKPAQNEGNALIAENRKARHEFFIEERLEAGIALTGWEVKALRAGRAQLAESYVVVSHGEIAMHCQAVISAFVMRSDDCELHFYSINIDAASERLLAPLLCGARVVLRGQGQWGAE